MQRVLGAKDENHARVGPEFAGLIKIIPVFIFVLPGLLAYTLASTRKLNLSGLTEAEGVVNSKGIYTAMITQSLPVRIKGFIIAALLAALMSTVSGALNSISTLTAFDLYKHVKSDANDLKLVLIGLIAVGVAVIASIAVVPFLNEAPSIFNALNSIITHIAPPVTFVFVLGIFWKRTNVVLAVNALGLETFLLEIPFMMMAFYLFVLCVCFQVIMTLGSKQRVPKSSSALCWDSPMDPLRAKG